MPQRQADDPAALGAVAVAVRVAAVPREPLAAAQTAQVVGVVVHAVVQVLKTKKRLVVAVLAMSRVAVMTNKDAVIEVGLTLAAMVAGSVQGVVQVVGVVVQAVFQQINNKTLVVVEVSAVGRVAVNMDTHPVVAVGLMLAAIVAVSVKLEMQVAGVVVHAAVEVLKTKTRLVVAVLAVVRVEVKMNKHAVVVVSLVLAAMAAVAVKVEVRVAGVVVHAAVKVVKTEPRFVVAVLMIARVAVGMDKHAMLVVGLTLAVMVAVSVKMEVHAMRVVVQAVGVVHKMITGAAPLVGLMVVVEMQTLAQVRTAAVTMVPELRKTMASRVVIVSLVDMTAKVQGHAALVLSVTAGKSVDVNIHAVVAALAVGRAKVKMNKHAVVVVGLMLAAMVVVSVMVEMQVVGVVVHAAVKVLKTKTGLVVAVLAVGRVALMMIKHAVVVVGLTMAEMVAVPVQVEVHVMRVVVQAVGVVHKMITGAAPFVGLMVLVEMQTVSQVRTVVVMMVPELCTMLAWEGVSFTLMAGVLFVPMWGTAFAKSLISMIALLQPRPERSLTPVMVIEAWAPPQDTKAIACSAQSDARAGMVEGA